MDRPTTLVIFGATGDLTARKLVPSLYRLAFKRRLPAGLRIVGVARSPLTDDTFRDRMAGAIREHAAREWSDDLWRPFSAGLHYVSGDAARAGGLDALRDWLKAKEGPGGGNRLYYLAVSPDLYEGITRNLGASGLATEDGWRR